MKNPNWQRDELILAIDLYFELENESVDSSHPKVIELSKVLNQLSIIHKTSSIEESFRNANGVSMKLSSYKRFDSKYSGKGLEKGNKLEKVIWDEFSHRRQELTELANKIVELATNKDFSRELSTIQRFQ